MQSALYESKYLTHFSHFLRLPEIITIKSRRIVGNKTDRTPPRLTQFYTFPRRKCLTFLPCKNLLFLRTLRWKARTNGTWYKLVKLGFLSKRLLFFFIHSRNVIKYQNISFFSVKSFIFHGRAYMGRCSKDKSKQNTYDIIMHTQTHFEKMKREFSRDSWHLNDLGSSVRERRRTDILKPIESTGIW